MAQSIIRRENSFECVENISFNSVSVKDKTSNFIESIKQYIFKNDCPKLAFDISNLNIIDASKVALLCSTYHYAKYPHGEISWMVGSKNIQDLVKPLSLGNMKIITS